MRIEYFLQTRVPLYSKARDFCLGKSVKLYTDKICDAMILFLIEQYETNEKCCLIGDIGSLYKRKKEIDQKRLEDNITYREHLQELMRKGVHSAIDDPKRQELEGKLEKKQEVLSKRKMKLTD